MIAALNKSLFNFDNYLEDCDQDWAFTAAEIQEFCKLSTNNAQKNGWVDHCVEYQMDCVCGAATSAALLSFINYGAGDNCTTASSMMDKLLPFVVDMNDQNQRKIAPLVMSTDRDFHDKSSLDQDNLDSAGKKAVQGDKHIALGGYDLVSVKRANIHLALHRVGSCDQGYEWKSGVYNAPCDKCKANTGQGYNCAGGGHYVCGGCVSGALSGGSGP